MHMVNLKKVHQGKFYNSLTLVFHNSIPFNISSTSGWSYSLYVFMCQSFRCCKSPTKRTRHGNHLRCTRMRHGGKGKCNVNLSQQKGLMWLSNKMESLTPSLWHLLIRNMNHSFGNGDFVWSWFYSTYKITVIRFICVYIHTYIYSLIISAYKYQYSPRFGAALCHASTSRESSWALESCGTKACHQGAK